MKESTIYSIGHGNKEIEDFIKEVKSFEIHFLLDIRSKPFSKWNPQFNQSELKLKLEENGIKYVFVGDALGGLPEDRSCYDYDGKVVYDLIKDNDFFVTWKSDARTEKTKMMKRYYHLFSESEINRLLEQLLRQLNDVEVIDKFNQKIIGVLFCQKHLISFDLRNII